MPDPPPDDPAPNAAGLPAPPRSTGGGAGWAPPTPEHLQQLLPQYEILEMLGAGGMGAVYKARQITLDRLVAIKILPPEILDDAEGNFTERFINEARTMARMNHPAIVHVHDFGQTPEGQLYFVMEYVDGTDVAKMLQVQERLPPDYALAITAHVCDALTYAHEHGVIHRDIKPANVLINMEGQVKVADFGLAKANDPSRESGITQKGLTMGTPDFVAPEALTLGATVDQRADLYAVGVMLYNMLTGQIPRGVFDTPSMKAGCDPRFDAIVLRAMKAEPDERYQSAAEIRRDLDVILTVPLAKMDASAGTIPRQYARQQSARRPGGRHPASESPAHGPAHPKKSGALGTFVVLALVALGGFIGWQEFGKTKPSVEQQGKDDKKPGEIAQARPAPLTSDSPGKKPLETMPTNVPHSGTTNDRDAKTPPPVAAHEAWTDWLDGLKHGRKLPDGVVWKGEGIEAVNPKVFFVLGPLMKDGAVRVTEVRGPAKDIHLFLRCEEPDASALPEKIPYSRAYRMQDRSDAVGVLYRSPKEGAAGYAGIGNVLRGAHDSSKPHVMELRVVGEKLTAWFDGQPFMTGTDTRIAQGVPAIYAEQGEWIQKIEVLNLDDTPIPGALLKQYLAALTRNREAATAEEKAADDAEMTRLKTSMTMSATDAPDTPKGLKDLREIVRKELAKKR